MHHLKGRTLLQPCPPGAHVVIGGKQTPLQNDLPSAEVGIISLGGKITPFPSAVMRTQAVVETSRITFTWLKFDGMDTGYSLIQMARNMY